MRTLTLVVCSFLYVVMFRGRFLRAKSLKNKQIPLINSGLRVPDVAVMKNPGLSLDLYI